MVYEGAGLNNVAAIRVLAEHNVQTHCVARHAVLPRLRGRTVFALVPAAPPKGHAFGRHITL